MTIRWDKAVFAGHSHLFALGAPQGYDGPLELVEIERIGRPIRFLSEKWGGTGRSPDYWNRLVELSAENPVAFVYYGNHHYIKFMFRPTPMFDFYDPDVPAISEVEGTIVLPRSLIIAEVHKSLVPLNILLEKFRKAGCPGVRVLGTPAPKRDSNAYRDILMRLPHIKQVAAAAGIEIAEAEMSPECVLLKMWRATQQETEALCLKMGAEFIPVPPKSLDEDGYLADSCSSPDDFTHANAFYGELMLDWFFNDRK